MFHVVFFDFGGTLVGAPGGDVDTLRQRLWKRTTADHGFPRPGPVLEKALERAERELGAEIYRYVGRVDVFWRRFNRRVMDRLNIPQQRTALHEALEFAFRAASIGELYPETKAVLGALRDRGVRMGVISNHNDALIRVPRHHGLSRFFETVTYSREAGAEKPDPGVFRLALRRAGCAPGEALHVGDSWSADVVGARGVGIHPVWLDRAARGGRRGCVRITSLSGLFPYLAPDDFRGANGSRDPSRASLEITGSASAPPRGDHGAGARATGPRVRPG